MSAASDAPATCDACSGLLAGRYCHGCGHDSRPPPRRIHDLAEDLFDNVFSSTRMVPTTLKDMVLRPGAVPRAHMEGDRSRYLSPVKLYVTASLIFFLFLGVSGVALLQLNVTRTGDPWVRITSDRWEAGGFNVMPVWLHRPRAEEPDRAVLAAFDRAANQKVDADEFDRSTMSVMRNVIENPAALNDEISTWMPRALWLLMPVYGLLLWLLYARRHLLIEHVIFALWAHSMMFLMLMLGAMWNFVFHNGLELAFLGYQVWMTRGLKSYYETRWSTAIMRGGVHTFVYTVLVWMPLLVVFFLWQAAQHVSPIYWLED